MSSPQLGGRQIQAQAESSPQARRLGPPSLTLQTPSSPGFQQVESDELLPVPSASSQSFPPWSPPPSGPPSASEYFGPNDVPPWLSNSFRGEPTQPHHVYLNRQRASSCCASETSTQDDFASSPTLTERNQFFTDTSQPTLDVPQIEVTSWDMPRPQSPAQSPAENMDLSPYYPPELSTGSWSSPSTTPSIIALSYLSDENFSRVHQSLPSHSRRSSINSQAPEFDFLADRKYHRPRSVSDIFPVAQQFAWPEHDWPEHDLNDFQYDSSPHPTMPNLQKGDFAEFNHNPTSSPPQSKTHAVPNQNQTDDLYNRTFLEVVHPLFPVLSPQNMPRDSAPQLSRAPTSQPNNNYLSPSLAQTQSLLTRAISSYILSMRSSQSTVLSSHYFELSLRSYGAGKWDSLPGIQSGILLAIYVLISGFPDPNLYMLNAKIVAACLDMGLHRAGLREGSLEANTLLAAYVLDRTVALVRERPCLLKDDDLEEGVLVMMRSQLRKKAERGDVRRREEGGRLWDWWSAWEESVRSKEMDMGMEISMLQKQVQQQQERLHRKQSFGMGDNMKGGYDVWG